MRNILIPFIFFTFFSLCAQTKSQSVGFIENKGQVLDQKNRPNQKVKYLLNTNGLNVQLRQYGFSYDIYETKKHPLNKKQRRDLEQSNFIKGDTLKYPNYTLEYIYHRIDIDFENPNRTVELIAKEKSTDYDNYYNIAHTPDGVIEVHKFQKITYKNIYDHIDVVFFIPEDKSKPVEYNFVVNPGGKIADIQLKFNGAKTGLVDNKIKMNVRFGQMEETLPLSWTETGTDKKEIAIGYKKIKKNVYGFETLEALNNKKIIIDPVPIRLWGTYYGGSGNEFASSINIDSNNNVIIAGATGSSNNIATSGPNTSGYTSGGAFIAKFSPAGQRIWSSYYPFGTGGLKLDGQNNMYLIGSILNGNPNIPSSGCHQPVKDIYTSGYLIKLNSDGAKLWGTYYGGNHNEDLNSVAIDGNGNIYLVGATSSSDSFATPGALQLTKNSPGTLQTGFVAKFDSNGNRIWGTFYGGNLADGFFHCDISSDGYLYAVGTHNSSNNIATPGTFQPISSSTGGMIVKFDLNGNRIWGTFIADNSYILDGRLKGDNIFISGRAFSNGLGTPGTMYENFINPLPSGSMFSGSGNNSIIIKFNIQTQQYIWSTYFFEQILAFDVDSSDNVFFSGPTGVENGIATPDGFITTKSPYDKSYLIKLNAFGQKIWGTYYGGNRAEQLGRVKIDLNNDIYLYGNTNGSTTGIATPGASQTELGSNPDTYLVKFKDCLSAAAAASNSPVCIGSPINLTASGGTNYLWTGPNNFSSDLQNPIIPNATIANTGQYSCNIAGTGGCDGMNIVNVVVGDSVKPVPNVTSLPLITGDCNTTITIPTAKDNCAGIIMATTTDALSYSLPGTYIIHWTYNDGNGNIENQDQTVTITAVTLPTLASPQTFCIQQNANLSSIAITGQNIKWFDAPTDGNLLINTTSLVNGTTYYASQTINNCESLRTPVSIDIQNTPAPTGTVTQSFCSTQNPTLNDIVVNGSNIVWYSTISDNNPLSNSTILTNGTTYYSSQNINNCESINRFVVTVNLINGLNANDFSDTICGDLNDGTEIIDLTSYSTNLISNTSNCIFEYYSSLAGATNQDSSALITSIINYNLNVGLQIVYVRITSDNGCHQVVQLNLTLVSKPVITIPDIVPVCEKADVTVDAGFGFDSYSWSTGSISQSVTVSQIGDYSVTVTKQNGDTVCYTTKNFTVVLSNVAIIASIETKDWTETENIIIVNITGIGDYEFSIDGIHYQQSNVFLNLRSGFYTVYIRDKNGCGIAKKDVFLFMYTKFLTPNGDGYNDTWAINFSYLEPDIKVNIFDRYGKLLKKLDNTNSWDGTYNGNGLPSDDYWFVVTRANGEEYKGHFTLKR